TRCLRLSDLCLSAKATAIYNRRSLVSFRGALVIIHTREPTLTLLSFYSLPPHLTMEFSAADFEKLVMFEHARKACEAHYVKGGGGGGGPAASSNATGGKKKNKRRRTMASHTMYVVGSLSLVGLSLGLA
ncbi:hypothetical protein HID58_060703, partial [Brassica napus]